MTAICPVGPPKLIIQVLARTGRLRRSWDAGCSLVECHRRFLKWTTFSSPFELCVQGVKTLESLRENFLITQALFRPSFEDLFDAEPFDSMKLVVLHIGIVNEFS